MKDANEMSDRKNSYLSPQATHEAIEKCPARRRSASMTASARSSRSAITVVDCDTDSADKENHKDIPMTDTKVIEITVSWLDCFLGLFRKTSRKHTATIDVEVMKDDETKAYITDLSPWILDVCVLSAVDDASNRSTKHEAKCLIDTGNMQGNFVSRDFALKLGYTNSKFRPLKKFEQNGGTSSTGHTLIPQGALHLTWYHSSSPRTFRDMRFLVSEDPNCDLVIGTRSIQKYNLLCPPNLAQFGTTVIKKVPDKERTQLNILRAELKNKLHSITQERKKAQASGKLERVEELDKEIDEVDKTLRVARLELELFDAQHELRRDPDNPKKISIVDTIDKDLREAQSKLPIHAQPKPLKRAPSEIDPTITMTSTSSTNRTLTFRRSKTRPKN